jgi:hypothetical protein
MFFQNIINMPCGIFYCATCHNLKPSLIMRMDDVDQYFEKEISIQTFSKCHMLDFNKWMTINDVSMTSWV